MTAYYNENEPFAAAWLRNLIAAGHIAPADVDERSILDVKPDDLRGYTQIHLFAGIAGWSRALRLAGWPDDRPVLTASCPCPPFSSAGKKASCPGCSSGLLVWCPRRTGFAICAECGHAWMADARHLWPEAWRLIAERRPEHILGEQVASPSGLVWLAGVRGSLEMLGYGLGAADLPACSVGAPHIRQRIFWGASRLANAGRASGHAEYRDQPRQGLGRGAPEVDGAGVGQCCGAIGLADPQEVGRSGRAEGIRRQARGDAPGSCGRLGHADSQRPQGRREYLGEYTNQRSPWASGQFIECTDGKSRRIESGIFPLASGFPNRVGVLRGSGNSIVPPLAAEFIAAFMECAP